MQSQLVYAVSVIPHYLLQKSQVNINIKQIPIKVRGEINTGSCIYDFEFTIIIDWDFNTHHLPKVISTTLTSFEVVCSRGSSCNANLDSFTYDEQAMHFNNLVFSSNCVDVQSDLNNSSNSSHIADDLSQAISNYVASNGH